MTKTAKGDCYYDRETRKVFYNRRFPVFTCATCGKQFAQRQQKYCSQRCFQTDRQAIRQAKVNARTAV